MEQEDEGHAAARAAGARGSISQRFRRLATGSSSRSMTALAVHARTPLPHREAGRDQDAEDGDNGRVVVPYSSPESGFRGYTFELAEALKDLRQERREVKGGLMGPLRAVAEFERLQDQRNEAFRLWLRGVMRREQEMAKKAAFTVIKRRDQMLQEVGPDWFQQLSWDQMQTVNALQAAHRADAEEGGASRVASWCGKLGVTPIPSARQIRRALRQQPEDHEAFLLALYAVISKSGKTPVPGDPPAPKLRTGFEYTPSERLLLSALAHLRLPHVIAKLVEQFGEPEKQPRYLRINPEVPARAARTERYLWPYLEPLPVPQLDWLELYSANHTAYVENLYMRSHKLPSTLIEELQAKPKPRVAIPPQAGIPSVT
ncbi:Nitrate reductase [NADH] [Frankliniella fusca]|uniref:Nitrate reductase [NADH] n=1 Tax=Frankliniella fusca TaxID=407009 RepID=A0AAE1H3I9_9NEOP|nr:Nitrate reductase [NADH] [Frankliniella fusca]